MARPRLKGFLDPIYAFTDHGRVDELARLLEVSRQTINRWQRDPTTVSEIYKMRLNLLFIARKLRPPFPVTDKSALRSAIRT